jgi:hypothetical protein
VGMIFIMSHFGAGADGCPPSAEAGSGEGDAGSAESTAGFSSSYKSM